jgi:hypothetical protein
VITRLLARAFERLRTWPTWAKSLGTAIVISAVLGIALPAWAMSQPAYLSRLPELSGSQQTLSKSAHAGIACVRCHDDRRGTAVRTVTLTLDFYRTVADPGAGLRFAETGSPDNAACLSCHAEEWSYDSKRTAKIPHPAHLRVSTETRRCSGCHKWTAHREKEQEEHKSMPLSSVCGAYGCHAGEQREDTCASCHHTLGDQPQDWARNHSQSIPLVGAPGCLERCHEAAQCQQCHTTGKSPFKNGLGVTGTSLLEARHSRPDWANTHGTDALGDKSKCMTCHVSEGECISCHSRRPASHGRPQDTWIGTHKNAVKSDKQCLTCHKKAWCDECHKQFKETR